MILVNNKRIWIKNIIQIFSEPSMQSTLLRRRSTKKIHMSAFLDFRCVISVDFSILNAKKF